MGQAKLRGTFEQRQAEAVGKSEDAAREVAKRQQLTAADRRSAGKARRVDGGTIGHSRVISASALVAMVLVAMNGGVRL